MGSVTLLSSLRKALLNAIPILIILIIINNIHIIMDKKIFQVIIFQQDNLIYYNDFLQKHRNYQQLKQTHRMQNCYGLSMSICALIKQIYPDNSTQFRNFKTKEYQYNLFQTVNGLKIILISSVLSKSEDDEIENSMKKIYQNYIELVKRNYLYVHGSTIQNDKFDQAIQSIIHRRNA